MIIVVNGSEREVPADATVAGVVATLAGQREWPRRRGGGRRRGRARAATGPRRGWARARSVEVVSAVQGG